MACMPPTHTFACRLGSKQSGTGDTCWKEVQQSRSITWWWPARWMAAEQCDFHAYLQCHTELGHEHKACPPSLCRLQMSHRAWPAQHASQGWAHRAKGLYRASHGPLQGQDRHAAQAAIAAAGHDLRPWGLGWRVLCPRSERSTILRSCRTGFQHLPVPHVPGCVSCHRRHLPG